MIRYGVEERLGSSVRYGMEEYSPVGTAPEDELVCEYGGGRLRFGYGRGGEQ